MGYLNSPAAANSNRWATVAVASGVVFFVLFCLAPFGLHAVSFWRRMALSGGFAVVTALSVSLTAFGFPILFKRFYDVERWTEGRNLLHYAVTLAVVAVGNYAFSVYVFGLPTEVWLKYLLVCVLMTALVGIIPMFIVYFFVRSRSLRRHLEEARQMNFLLTQRLEVRNDAASDEIILAADTREPMRVGPNDIVYLESWGNYVKLNYLKGGELKRRLLRATLSQTVTALGDCPSITRCHRAFVVNLDHICSVEGNSQGLRLRLTLVAEQVPVSRSYIKEVLGKIRGRN